jgi:hypothetical protein
MKNEPPASLRARRTPRRYFLPSAEKMDTPKGFTFDGVSFVFQKGLAIFWKAAFSLLSKMFSLANLAA